MQKHIMKNSSTHVEGGVELAGVQLGMQADTFQLKMLCAMKLNDYLDTLGWTQARIGRELGLSQPHVSELRNYAIDRFSVDRILGFMTAMGLRINIQIDVPENNSVTPKSNESKRRIKSAA